MAIVRWQDTSIPPRPRHLQASGQKKQDPQSSVWIDCDFLAVVYSRAYTHEVSSNLPKVESFKFLHLSLQTGQRTTDDGQTWSANPKYHYFVRCIIYNVYNSDTGILHFSCRNKVTAFVFWSCWFLGMSVM